MNRTDALLILAGVALAGASSATAAQAAAYAASIHVGTPGVDSLVMRMIWGWAVVLTVAVPAGVAGGYRAMRSGNIRQPLLLVFFLLYSLTMRVDNVSLGWPWQAHAGLVMGRVGLGVNLVGVALLIWYRRTWNRPDDQPAASLVGSVDAFESAVAFSKLDLDPDYKTEGSEGAPS